MQYRSQGVLPMKFLCIYKPAKKEGTPPTQQEIERMGKLIDDWMKEGVLLATEGCLPSSLGARVRQTNGKVSVTDGPIYGVEGVSGWIRADSNEFESGSHRTHENLPGDRGRWRNGNTAGVRMNLRTRRSKTRCGTFLPGREGGLLPYSTGERPRRGSVSQPLVDDVL